MDSPSGGRRASSRLQQQSQSPAMPKSCLKVQGGSRRNSIAPPTTTAAAADKENQTPQTQRVSLSQPVASQEPSGSPKVRLPPSASKGQGKDRRVSFYEKAHVRKVFYKRKSSIAPSGSGFQVPDLSSDRRQSGCEYGLKLYDEGEKSFSTDGSDNERSFEVPVQGAVASPNDSFATPTKAELEDIKKSFADMDSNPQVRKSLFPENLDDSFSSLPPPESDQSAADMELTGTITNGAIKQAIQNTQRDSLGGGDMSFTTVVGQIQGSPSVSEGRPSMAIGDESMEFTRAVGHIHQTSAGNQPSTATEDTSVDMETTRAFGSIEAPPPMENLSFGFGNFTANAAQKRSASQTSTPNSVAHSPGTPSYSMSMTGQMDMTLAIGKIHYTAGDPRDSSFADASAQDMELTINSIPEIPRAEPTEEFQLTNSQQSALSGPSMQSTPIAAPSSSQSSSGSPSKLALRGSTPGRVRTSVIRSTPLRKDITKDLKSPSPDQSKTNSSVSSPTPAHSKASTMKISVSPAVENTPTQAKVSAAMREQEPSEKRPVTRSSASKKQQSSSPMQPQQQPSPTPTKKVTGKRKHEVTPRRQSLRNTPERQRMLEPPQSPTPPSKKLMQGERALMDESPAKSIVGEDNSYLEKESFLDSFPASEIDVLESGLEKLTFQKMMDRMNLDEEIKVADNIALPVGNDAFTVMVETELYERACEELEVKIRANESQVERDWVQAEVDYHQSFQTLLDGDLYDVVQENLEIIKERITGEVELQWHEWQSAFLVPLNGAMQEGLKMATNNLERIQKWSENLEALSSQIFHLEQGFRVEYDHVQTRWKHFDNATTADLDAMEFKCKSAEVEQTELLQWQERITEELQETQTLVSQLEARQKELHERERGMEVMPFDERELSSTIASQQVQNRLMMNVLGWTLINMSQDGNVAFTYRDLLQVEMEGGKLSLVALEGKNTPQVITQFCEVVPRWVGTEGSPFSRLQKVQQLITSFESFLIQWDRVHARYPVMTQVKGNDLIMTARFPSGLSPSFTMHALHMFAKPVPERWISLDAATCFTSLLN